jgi:hypothetical protein
LLEKEAGGTKGFFFSTILYSRSILSGRKFLRFWLVLFILSSLSFLCVSLYEGHLIKKRNFFSFVFFCWLYSDEKDFVTTTLTGKRMERERKKVEEEGWMKQVKKQKA